MGLNKFITKKGRVLLDLTEDTVTPETLGKGVTAHDRSGAPIVGTMESGGGGGEVEFNIAYGDTEPTDTSKLWVKASEPEAVQVTTRGVSATETFESISAGLPTGASNIASAVVGTKVYLFGGTYIKGTNAYLNTINVFDTESNTITTLSTTLPTAASNISSAVVGTKVYLFGGYDGSNPLNTINVFDTESNTITTLTTKLPTAAWSMGCTLVGKKVYLFGGRGGSSGRSLNTINVFDTESNTITTLSTTLPTAADNFTAALVGTKVYMFGGLSMKSSGTYLNTITVFDTESNTITTLTTKLPKAAYAITSAVVGTKVYLFGGAVSGSYLNTINVFDTENNTITTLGTTLQTAAYGIASAVVGTKVYLFGGCNGATNGSHLTTINAFVVSVALAANHILINVGSSANTFYLLPNVELGVNFVYLGNTDGVAETVGAALYVDGAWVEI